MIQGGKDYIRADGRCQGMRQPAEAGKGKKTSSPLESPERNTYQHLDFSEIDLVRPILNS